MSTLLSILLAVSAMGAVEQAVYPDENRGPLGKDAQTRVLEMQGTKFKRPHFRMPGAEYRQAWETLRHQPIPKWLQDGKFGIYTHWGLYSIPANKEVSNTYIRYMYQDRVDAKKGATKVSTFHTQRYGDPTEFGYSDFTRLFTCKGFDGQEYVDTMKDAETQ